MPKLQFAALGTTWTIESAHALGTVDQLIRDRIESFDQTWSRFRADSLVTAVATRPGSYEFSDDAPPLFDLYDRLFNSTDGAMTPLVGRSLEHLGYDREYSLTVTAPAESAADWQTAVQRSGSRVTVAEPALIDVGAAGKGHIVDIVGELLRDHDIDEFVIDASGDLLVSSGSRLGGTVHRIALEHPLDPSLAIGVAELSNGSICASGSNRRVWGEGLHHILDGRTGLPTRDVIATWAIAPTALVADGLATALFFADPARLAEDFEFEYVKVFASGATERSRTFHGELFS